MVIGKCSDTQEDGVRALPTLPVPDKSTQIELNLGSLLKGGGSTLKYSERSYPFSSLSPQISGRGLKSRFAITSNKEKFSKVATFNINTQKIYCISMPHQ